MELTLTERVERRKFAVVRRDLIEHVRRHGPIGYGDAVLAEAKHIGDALVWIDRRRLDQLRQTYRPAMSAAEIRELRELESQPVLSQNQVQRLRVLTEKRLGYPLPVDLPLKARAVREEWYRHAPARLPGE